MSLFRILSMTLVALVAMTAQNGPNQPPTPRKRRLLCIGESKGWQHDSISHAMATMWQLGNESGLWDTYIRTDTQLITKKTLPVNGKNLDYFDAVYFFTTGELDMDDEQKAALISFVHDDGKGFIGGHSATDTFYKWPAYGEMIGGHFNDHPWNTATATVNVEDPQFPGMQQFGPSFSIHDEFYQLKDYSRSNVRVLLSLDTASLDMKNPRVKRTDGDFAVAWARTYGKGRVFACSLGHPEATYDRPDMRKMYFESIKWAMGITDGDATPRSRPNGHSSSSAAR